MQWAQSPRLKALCRSLRTSTSTCYFDHDDDALERYTPCKQSVPISQFPALIF